MIQATEGVSRNILKQTNMRPTMGSTIMQQALSSSDYTKYSPVKASSPYKAHIPRKVTKIATKPYTINPAEIAKTKHRKVRKGPDFMYGKGLNDFFNKERLPQTFNIPNSWESVL